MTRGMALLPRNMIFDSTHQRIRFETLILFSLILLIVFDLLIPNKYIKCIENQFSFIRHETKKRE